MKITIVGCGHAGCAHAGMLTQLGHDVTIFKSSRVMHNEDYAAIRSRGELIVCENGRETVVTLAGCTDEAGTAFREANVVLIMTQSVAHPSLATKICAHLRDGQVVIAAPGYCGSVYFARLTHNKSILYGEGESLPYDARLVAPGRVNICSTNVRNPVGFFPAKRRNEGIEILQHVLPNYTLRHNILESAMHNPNLIVHTIGAIMSVGRIEYSAGEFWMYREAFTPSIWNLVYRLDGEKLGVLRALGLPEQSFAESFRFRNFEDLTTDPLAVFRHYAEHGSPKGPEDAKTRYITEDVPMGLCLLSSLGRTCAIQTPVSDALIAIASAIGQTDYTKAGRTLESLGLAGLSLEELKEIFDEGGAW